MGGTKSSKPSKSTLVVVSKGVAAVGSESRLLLLLRLSYRLLLERELCLLLDLESCLSSNTVPVWVMILDARSSPHIGPVGKESVYLGGLVSSRKHRLALEQFVLAAPLVSPFGDGYALRSPRSERL